MGRTINSLGRIVASSTHAHAALEDRMGVLLPDARTVSARGQAERSPAGRTPSLLRRIRRFRDDPMGRAITTGMREIALVSSPFESALISVPARLVAAYGRKKFGLGPTLTTDLGLTRQLGDTHRWRTRL
jgi:hypothetical protein